MEIKRISPTRMTIALDAADLRELGVTYESLDYLCPQTRLAIRQLLETAHAQTGFSADGHRLLIHAQPLEAGGCLLTFTLMEPEPAEPVAPAVFAFSSFEELAAACTRVQRQYGGLVKNSSLYRWEGQYLLAVETSGPEHGPAEDLLSQYGRQLQDGLLPPALEEHGQLLRRPDAVSVIARYFP